LVILLDRSQQHQVRRDSHDLITLSHTPLLYLDRTKLLGVDCRYYYGSGYVVVIIYE